jgi:peptidoglycan/LPS O-acetylase OafA/YrhL
MRIQHHRLLAEQRHAIPTLDGWRAVAIALVIVHHAGTAFYASWDEYLAHAPTRFGMNGVPIFFALSGLLICKLLLEEQASTGHINLRSFYVRRCFRILPPLFAFLLVSFLVGYIVKPLELVSAVFFFRNYLPNSTAYVYSEHLWSLSVEEHFYLLWPLFLSWLVTMKRPAVYTAGLALGFGIWRFIDLHLHLTAKVLPAFDTAWRTDYHLDSLLWGCVAAFLLQDSRTRNFLTAKVNPLLFVSLLAIYVACLTLPVPMRGILIPMTIPLMLLGTLTHGGWLASRFLSLAPIRWIGRISYSLYLWQQLLFVPRWEPHVLPYLQRLPLNLALVVTLASASFYLIERPLIRVGRTLAFKVGSSSQQFAISKA